MKPWLSFLLKTLGLVLCILLGIIIFYQIQIHDLTKLGYSRTASERIFFSKNKDYVMSLGENKTVNLAFESEEYNEKYLDNYAKIKYVDHKDIITNINKLLDLGYSNSDINLILSHGSNEAVTSFTKHERVHYLEEYYSYDFAKIENNDRYVEYSDENGTDELDTILYVNLNLDKEAYVDYTVIDKFSFDMLVNKYRSLKEDFIPEDLVTIDGNYASSDDFQCNRVAYNALIEMIKAAEKDGYYLIVNSAYRSYYDQEETCNLYRDYYGQSYVDKYVAKPGFSEHQTGLAFDIGSRNTNVFANSSEYGWMLDNAYKYGFIYRYDERYEDMTKFRAEPWHYRYVGKEIAEYVHEHNNMSLEEYYVMFLDK